MSSTARAARRRQDRYAEQGKLDPARLYQLNAQRRLPADYPSSVPHTDTDPDPNPDPDIDDEEEGIDPSVPIITTEGQARHMYEYVARTGVVPHIDAMLRDHPGEQPVLSTRMILTAMLLAIRLRGRYMRTVCCAVLAGLDAAVAVEWGLLDPDTGRSLLSYNMVARQSKRLETFLGEGAVTPDGTQIGLQWMVDHFLAPSVPKRVARKVTEIALDATDYETWARTRDFTPQKEIDAGHIPPDTILKPNGKTQRTDDTGAGHGRRSKKAKYQSEHFNGWWDTLAVAIRAVIGGKRREYVPPYILAMAVAPADEEAGPIGYQVTVQAKRLARKLKVVKADQHYTRKNATFVRPLREQGWDLVMNQSVDEQKIVRPITAGKHNTPLLVHCGTILPVWTPEHLLLPPDGLSGADLQEWYDRREKYRWRVVQQFKNGRIKTICPQCDGKVKSTARTRNRGR